MFCEGFHGFLCPPKFSLQEVFCFSSSSVFQGILPERGDRSFSSASRFLIKVLGRLCKKNIFAMSDIWAMQ